jgi:hypothetical protein
MDCVSVSLFELTDGCEAGFDDVVPDGVKVLWSLLELLDSECYKLSDHHSRLQWNHVRYFGEVKWKEGLDSMCYVIHGMPEGLVSGDPFSPEDGVHSSQLFSFLCVAYFHNCFLDV